MVDYHHQQTVCCMCGDIGFPDKLFRCDKCRHRFQHSYCSNYYKEISEANEVCDWCQSERRNINNNNSTSRHGSSSSSKKTISPSTHHDHNNQDGGGAVVKGGKHSNGVPSPRPTQRRYKLLKDVMC
ncbi:hypothetical protein ACFE04_026467 [Oxalis oulophora]